MAPISVLWLAKYDQRWESFSHHHEFFHLIAILGGVATMHIGDEEWMVQSEQCYLIPPRVEHDLCDRSGGKVALRVYDIKFAVHDAALYRDLAELPRPFLLDRFSRFSAQVETLLDESYRRLPYVPDLVNARFFLMLVEIVRRFRAAAPSSDEPPITPAHYMVRGIDLPALLKFIHSNIGHAITLDHLARVAGTNKTTLTEVIKQSFGVTPMRYVNQLRLSYAQEMLRNSDAGIGEIAASIGFTSHYFSRYFRAQMQCTPQEFRMRHANNRFYILSDSPDAPSKNRENE